MLVYIIVSASLDTEFSHSGVETTPFCAVEVCFKINKAVVYVDPHFMDIFQDLESVEYLTHGEF